MATQTMSLAQQHQQSLPALAEDIQREAKAIADFCASQMSPPPSLSQSWPTDLPEDIQASRFKIREAAKALHDIAVGPFDHLFTMAWGFHHVSTLRWIIHFKIPAAIPLSGTVSYADLASVCGVNVSHLRRILRFAMVNRLFHEPVPDHVEHTVYSTTLVTDPVLLGQLEFLTEDSFEFSTKLVEAQEQWPGSNAANHAAFNVARATDMQRYVWLGQDGHEKAARRFGNMLEFARQERATDTCFVVQGYKWENVDTVIDIGGGSGAVAVALAKAFPRLRITVEDKAHDMQSRKSELPQDLQDRIKLVKRDFFEARPEDEDKDDGAVTAGNRVFFLRMVCHNWPDKDVARIIQPLLPSVRAGTRLVVMDMMVPPPGTVPETMEWWMRSLDMEMMLEFNSRVRAKEDWERLFAGISPGLHLNWAYTPHRSGLTVMEYGYKS